MDNQAILIVGLLAVYAGLGSLVVFWGRSRRAVSADRRRPQRAGSEASPLSLMANKAVATVNRSLQGRELKVLTADKFEQAGVSMRAADFIVMSAGAAIAGVIFGWLIAGPVLGILVGILVVTGLLVWLNVKVSKRQGKFADQLPDTLQLIAGSMRAGHSLLRAIDAASEQSPQPMADELRRVINESRIGRDLGEALLHTAARMKSEDFLWTAQAIETQREVGGNLAEVLDNVNHTIRERAQLGRQVRALSAEGRLSAFILVALPIALLIIISMINPSYGITFFTTVPGWLMLGLIAVMMTLGTIWMLRLVKPKY
ncbi:hypothetical protein GCM10027449_23760 [Sinomonas notoginsengisoli]|uniref:type II secretion system F family protein n=1 Tax=Sinomonas notoginsengisoli TaxID=1457311 RepID=UPI001F372311|nr:type II secretion system F family protein [Sinomonas notoginsengisoli]